MVTAPTDPNAKKQPSPDITSSVNKFTGDVGAGAYNTARGYVDWSEKPLRDQPLTEVATGTLLGSTTPEAGWGEFYRRVDEEPGKIVGEVATEVGVNIATLGAAKAVQGTKIGAKAALQLSKAKGAVKSKVATATRGGREINKGTKKQWPVDKNIQTIQDIEKITGKSITKLNDEIDTAKKIKDNKISGWDSDRKSMAKRLGIKDDQKSWDSITQSSKREEYFYAGKKDGWKRLSRAEKAKVKHGEKLLRTAESTDPAFPHDPPRFVDEFPKQSNLMPGYKPTEGLNFGGFAMSRDVAKKIKGPFGREKWPEGSFESKISKISDDEVLRRLAVGGERKRRRRSFQRRSMLEQIERDRAVPNKWFGTNRPTFDDNRGSWSVSIKPGESRWNLSRRERIQEGIGSFDRIKTPTPISFDASKLAPKTKKRPFFSILFPTDKPESRDRRVQGSRRF